MQDSTDDVKGRAPLLTGLGSVALVVGLLWFDDGNGLKYAVLAAACVLYLASAVRYFIKGSERELKQEPARRSD